MLPSQTFVVVAAYNEVRVLGDVLDELLNEHPLLQIVVVDDGSTDDTYRTARQRTVHVLRHVVNRGQGAAIKTGIDYALGQGAEIVVTFDADGQMRAADILSIVEPVAVGACDVALGTRFTSGRPEGIKTARWMLLMAARLFTRWTTGLSATDTHNGFRAFSRKSLESMTLSQDRMAHASEMLHEIARHGLQWREVPVRIRYTEYSRRKGQSSWAAIDILLDLMARKR